MKRISAIIILMFLLLCPIKCAFPKSEALDSGQAYVITSKCDIYSLPDFSSDKLLDENNNIISLKHKQIVNILEIINDFAYIEVENVKGYVYKFYLTNNSSPIVYPVFNATIRKDCTVFDYDFEDSGYTLKKNTRIFVYEGYSSKQDYTAVQFILEDGSLYNGYVDKQFVDPDGVSSLLILGITIIISAVTIILSLIFIKKKKK